MGIGTEKRCADHSCRQPNQVNPPEFDPYPVTLQLPKGNRGASGLPTVTLILRNGFRPFSFDTAPEAPGTYYDIMIHVESIETPLTVMGPVEEFGPNAKWGLQFWRTCKDS